MTFCSVRSNRKYQVLLAKSWSPENKMFTVILGFSLTFHLHVFHPGRYKIEVWVTVYRAWAKWEWFECNSQAGLGQVC